MTRILGIETSCDDAAAALVDAGEHVRAEATASQAASFAAWGGVVPELAARGHVLALPGLVDDVLTLAGVAATTIDAVAVCAWPGLVGSLLPGVTTAKILALRWSVPLIAVDHIEAHLAAVHLHREPAAQSPANGADRIVYPLVGLVASGGHSHLYLARAPGELDLLGGTIDDAAGEAFDKCAAMLDLGYPGGPIVDALAAAGDPRAFALPRSFVHDDTLRLSFAGLKTALLYQVRGRSGRDALALSPQGVRDACASFQAAIVDCLTAKLLLAARRHRVRSVAVGGGVACNRGLRARLARDCAARGLTLHLPAPRHCADNAAMIAALGYHRLQRGERAGLDLAPLPSGRVGPRKQRVTAPP